MADFWMPRRGNRPPRVRKANAAARGRAVLFLPNRLARRFHCGGPQTAAEIAGICLA